MSSSANKVIASSLRSMVHFEPLKSKRVSISRRAPLMALSTSFRSVLETISKDGILDLVQRPGTLPQVGQLANAALTSQRGGYAPVPEGEGQGTDAEEQGQRSPQADIAVEPEGKLQRDQADDGRDQHAVSELSAAGGADEDAVQQEAPDRNDRRYDHPGIGALG